MVLISITTLLSMLALILVGEDLDQAAMTLVMAAHLEGCHPTMVEAQGLVDPIEDSDRTTLLWVGVIPIPILPEASIKQAEEVS